MEAAILPRTIYGQPWLGWLMAAGGTLMLGMAIRELQLRGGISRSSAIAARSSPDGLYAHVPRPICLGVGLMVVGWAVAARSIIGFWILVPAVAASLMVWSLAWDGPRIRRMARQLAVSLVILPEDSDAPPSRVERFRVLWLVVLPWLALYAYSTAGGVPPGAIRYGFSWEERIPVWEWTEILYGSTFPVVAIAPWLARTKRSLRGFMLQAWAAMAIAFSAYWIFPSIAPRRHTETEGVLSQLLLLERNNNPPTAAFPSFHVIWSILCGRLMRPAALGWAYSALVGITCITTGMHYLPDIAAGFLVGLSLLHLERIWEWITARGAAIGLSAVGVGLSIWLLFAAMFAWRLNSIREPLWFVFLVFTILAGLGWLSASGRILAPAPGELSSQARDEVHSG